MIRGMKQRSIGEWYARQRAKNVHVRQQTAVTMGGGKEDTGCGHHMALLFKVGGVAQVTRRHEVPGKGHDVVSPRFGLFSIKGLPRCACVAGCLHYMGRIGPD